MPGPVMLSDALAFPPHEWATSEGLLAVGGDLRPQRLLLAYGNGIFPWPHEGLPLLWFSPNPRMVLPPDEAHVSHSLRKLLRKRTYQVTLDTAFAEVMRGCAEIKRSHEAGTWISEGMIQAYCTLHEMGFAHSAEVWCSGELAGGLYGVSLGSMFFGESMFARQPSASKVAFVTLARQLASWSFTLMDCQVHTAHLASLGARPWERSRFLRVLRQAMRSPTRRGSWQLDLEG
ncbi:MAG: leucyl/phenylalanyl-tRNA--protein transferase [Polyangiaceae bacterium]|jgi:leucyl/phenylalanyl-tRNA--protein transferase|nr:leucyl/phenylalanyl-tRNA--protein transferase [Polyangiaceae bacterium]